LIVVSVSVTVQDAFSAKQRGDSFQIVLAPHDSAQGAVTGTVYTEGLDINIAGSETVRVDNITAGLADAFKASDMVKFQNHSKVYMVTADVSAGSGFLKTLAGDYLLQLGGTDKIKQQIDGQLDLSITPPLIQDLTDNETVTYDNVQFTMTFKNGIQKFKTGATNKFNFAVDLIEAIN